MYQIRICRRESEAAVKRSDLANFDPDTPLEKLGWARTLRGSILVLDSCVFFRQVPEESSIVLVVVPVEKKRAVNGWFVYYSPSVYWPQQTPDVYYSPSVYWPQQTPE